MKLYKKYVLEEGSETFCVFDVDEHNDYVNITGAENTHGEWYYFNLDTTCDISKLDDESYIAWLLYEENDGNGFSCGSYDSLEQLIECGERDFCDTEDLRYFLEVKQ